MRLTTRFGRVDVLNVAYVLGIRTAPNNLMTVLLKDPLFSSATMFGEFAKLVEKCSQWLSSRGDRLAWF